jgi:hypothetical protein
MALFGIGKKKEESPEGVPPMGMPGQAPPDYGGGYGAYPPEQYPEQYPPEGYAPEQYPPGAPMEQAAPMPAPGGSREEIEEIAEAIVEEKWREKEIEITKIMEWKEQVTAHLTQLRQQVIDLKASFDSLHKGMLGKITEYDENLTNVGTEIKAMEKVFSKVLPSLTDSVNKLGRISGTKKK